MLKGKTQQGNDKQQNDNLSYAILSKKHRAELHFYLFKACLLKDNKPENYSQYFKTFITLFKQSRHRSLEYSVPVMFKLQQYFLNESLKPNQVNMSFNSIPTIVLSYFYILCLDYKNKDLEKYLNEIINKRTNENQISKQFLNLMKEFYSQIIISDNLEIQNLELFT
jgi:hypothetical protein